jgi:hypothetical protein
MVTEGMLLGVMVTAVVLGLMWWLEHRDLRGLYIRSRAFYEERIAHRNQENEALRKVIRGLTDDLATHRQCNEAQRQHLEGVRRVLNAHDGEVAIDAARRHAARRATLTS